MGAHERSGMGRGCLWERVNTRERDFATCGYVWKRFAVYLATWAFRVCLQERLNAREREDRLVGASRLRCASCTRCDIRVELVR